MTPPASPSALIEAYVDWLIPDPTRLSIPVLAVLGLPQAPLMRIAKELMSQGRCVGMAVRAGVWIGLEQIPNARGASKSAARIVLEDPAVECGLLEVSSTAAVEEGLGFDRCDCVVVGAAAPGEEMELHLKVARLMALVCRGTIIADYSCRPLRNIEWPDPKRVHWVASASARAELESDMGSSSLVTFWDDRQEPTPPRSPGSSDNAAEGAGSNRFAEIAAEAASRLLSRK